MHIFRWFRYETLPQQEIQHEPLNIHEDDQLESHEIQASKSNDSYIGSMQKFMYNILHIGPRWTEMKNDKVIIIIFSVTNSE